MKNKGGREGSRGWAFVLEPVAIDVCLILIFAVVFYSIYQPFPLCTAKLLGDLHVHRRGANFI